MSNWQRKLGLSIGPGGELVPDEASEPSSDLSADQVVAILSTEVGQSYKAAGPDGVWDRGNVAKPPKVVKVNFGNGFEPAVAVPQDTGGYMVYLGPFTLENIPTPDRLFLFHSGRYFYIEGL